MNSKQTTEKTLNEALYVLVNQLITFELVDLNTIDDCGFVITITDGIAIAIGLLNVLSGELVSFTGAVKGMVISLEKAYVKILIFGNDSQISEDASKISEDASKILEEDSQIYDEDSQILEEDSQILDEDSQIYEQDSVWEPVYVEPASQRVRLRKNGFPIPDND